MLSVPFIIVLVRQWEINQILFVEKFQFLVLFVCICIISYILIKLPQWLNNYKKDVLKVSVYECGFEAFQTTKIKFNIQFFMVAFLFLIFDLEIMILFPFSGFVGQLSEMGQIVGIVFVFSLLIGFVYEWLSGILQAISNNILIKENVRKVFFFRKTTAGFNVLVFLPQLHDELIYASTDTAFFGIFLGGFTIALEGSSAFEIDFDFFLVNLIGFILLAKIFYLLVVKRIVFFLRANIYIFQLILFFSTYFFLFFYSFLEFFISFNFSVFFEDDSEEEFFSLVRNSFMAPIVFDFWNSALPFIIKCCSFDIDFLSIEILDLFFIFFILNLADFVTIFFCFVEFLSNDLLGAFQRYDAGTLEAQLMDTQYYY